MGKDTEITIKTKDVVSVFEAAELLGLSRVTVYRWIRIGKLTAIRFGYYRAIPRSEIERLKKS